MLKPKNSSELFKLVESENLLLMLIEQFNKDFLLSGISKVFDKTCSIEKLYEELEETLLNLIQFKYDDYLNLVYRVDISEKELAQITKINIEDIVNQITFLILKREFQKVWLKLNFK